MKKLLVCAAALGLFVSLAASAQNNDHHGDKKDAAAPHAERGSPSTGNNHNGQGASTMGGMHARSNDTHQTMNRGPAAGTTHTMSAGTQGRTPTANLRTNQYLPKSGDVRTSAPVRANAIRTQNNAGWSGNAATNHTAVNSRQGSQALSGNGGGQHADVSSLRRNIQAPQHFHAGSYSAPQGYQSRHWGYGEQLPRGYFVRDYWISDFLMYGLFSPPSDLVWVRVGDDALLIDRYSGDIIQVRYGVFY